MKISIRSFTCLLAALYSILLFNSCTNDDDPSKVYTITVTGDSDGTAEATAGGTAVLEAIKGTEITITATPAGDYDFKQWTVVSGDVTLSPDKTANPATFTMPAGNVEIRAEFEAVSRTVVMTVDGDGTAQADPADASAGTEVTITAAPDTGSLFVGWVIVRGGELFSDLTENPATFTMPAEEVEIRAEFRFTGIRTEADLREFSADWNAAYDPTGSTQTNRNKAAVVKKWGDDGTEQGTIRIHADITMTDGDFTPIGAGVSHDYVNNDCFSATFDGGGFTISGLKVSATTSNGWNNTYAGLFGHIKGGDVSNIVLSDPDISAAAPGSGTFNHSGGIAGDVERGSITDCRVTGGIISISGDYRAGYCGGIAGFIGTDGKVSSCTVANAAVTVSGNSLDAHAGGIAGLNICTISDCGTVSSLISTDGRGDNYSAGIVGYSAGVPGLIAGCYDTDNIISAKGDTGFVYAGGIVGYDSSSVITDCRSSALSITSGSSTNNYSGGIAGIADGSTIVGCSAGAALIASEGQIGTSGGITGIATSSASILGCYSLAGSITATRSGGIAGFSNSFSNPNTIAGCHWLKDAGQPAQALAEGTATVTGSHAFASAADFYTDNYDGIGAGVTLLSLMNAAIDSGYPSLTWRWTQGATTGDYPIGGTKP